MASLSAVTFPVSGEATDIVNVLTASDTFTYLDKTATQVIEIANDTGGTLGSINIAGGSAGSKTFIGGGTIDFSTGLDVSLDDGERFVAKLSSIGNYLSTGEDGCTITGATGCTCTIFNL